MRAKGLFDHVVEGLVMYFMRAEEELGHIVKVSTT